MNIKKSLSTYFPGILLFLVAMLIGLLTYQDYGISWDEPTQVDIGRTNYDYVTHESKQLLTLSNKEYGAGFEIPLIFIQRKMNITDERDIYLMRHLVTHIFFLISVLFGYVLIYRLFKNQFLACLGFFMLAFAPRIYAHSFFNTKDIPALSMFLISFTIFHAAFKEKKAALFLILGITCGYTTGIRVMGIMLGVLVLFFLLTDLVTDITSKKNPKKTIINTMLFLTGFCFILYISWPYLWGNPLINFMKAYNKMSHYIWEGQVLLAGKFEMSQHLPYYYFPIWFLISNPVLWLITGFAGIVWIMIGMFRKPLNFLKNTNDRNFLLYLCSFLMPIFAVMYLHSVIYDDWRHLYFIYPSFILMSLYFINKVYQKKFRLIVQSACIIQVGFISYFMIKNHPLQQVYFNSLVSHDKEYLRKNYDFDYWGASYLQALDHLVHVKPYGTIKICYIRDQPLRNNVMMLQERDRKRIELVECDQADYFITNFRGHPNDFPNPVEYSIVVLSSTVVCVYKVVH
ncbi:MAG: phospholipid carrier-dependent glycosyltransferase [Chitinophagales bacterium]